MKKEFFAAVRSGAKTTTLRFWLRPRVRPHSIHRIPGLGAVRIDEVQPVDPRRLTAADASADGFPSLPALRAALRRLYPPSRRNGRRLYRIRFTFLAER
ncbi:MAG TPA: ASCH domain-containing protein [Phycisphaerae bacterium]|nr:ASCH domain-containing protein [Phycisphaerae bacterium]